MWCLDWKKYHLSSRDLEGYKKYPPPLNPSLLTFFRLRSLAHSLGPGPSLVQVGLTGTVSKQAKRSSGRLIGRHRQMGHALTRGDVGRVVGSMRCQPWLSWLGQLVDPRHGHSPTWGPMLGAWCATSWHPIVPGHHYRGDQVGPPPVSRVPWPTDNAILLSW